MQSNMKPVHYSLTAAVILLAAARSQAQGVIVVENPIAFVHAVERARPGEVIKIHPGVYNGQFAFKSIRGTADKPITITAEDPANPPVFHGKKECLKFANPSWLVLDNLILEGATVNGLNIDDGDSHRETASHITLRNLRVRKIGRGGNNEAIKPSGLNYFTVENCVIEDWGAGDGQGIGMVGCHHVLIEGCTIGRGDAGQKSVGIMAKGGSTDVTIRRCTFVQAGERGVLIGGRTGRMFFRPQANQRFEAERVVVEDCRFIGGETPVAFAGCIDCTFRFNTVYHPRGYLMRILREDPGPEFDDTQRNAVTDNIFVFNAGSLRETFNIGAATQPGSFTFARNWWYASDRPQRSHVQIPATEVAGVYGIDPKLTDPEAGNLSLKPDSPAKAVGATHAVGSP